MIRQLFRRLHYLLNRRRLDAELADEMEFHREMAATHEGIPVGDALRLREDSREAWGSMWIDRLGQDLRYAFRAMRSSPGFTTAAVLVLALGIGATVAAFSTFNMVALRPMPVRDPGTLLRFSRHAPDRSWSEVPYPAVAFYREHTRTLAAVLAQTASRLNLEGAAYPSQTFFVSENFFDELGARPGLGRLFDAADRRPDAPPVVVLGHDFWVRHFGSDPSVVGKTVRLNDQPVTIIGVVAREFPGLSGGTPAFWALLERHGDFVHGSQVLTDFASGVTMWGRLVSGVSPQAAENELALLTKELRRRYPEDIREGERLVSKPGARPELTGAAEVFTLVGALVLLILAVACGNLGSLLLARGASRQREITLRVAIGAGTSRLVRQLFTESLVLALMGTVTGVVLGWAVVKILFVSAGGPSWLDPSPDWRVAVFATFMAFLSATLFGLTPALHIARQRLGMTFARRFLISTQVAASCVLLIVSGLLLRAFDRVTSVEPGFEYEHIVIIDPSLREHGYDAPRARAYLSDLEAKLLGIPGVASVARTTTPPLGGLRVTTFLEIEGAQREVYIHQVTPGFLETMEIPLRRGRNLSESEPLGIVVSESLARRRWPNHDPLGQPLQIGDEPPLIVVGIASDARTLALHDLEAVEFYRLAREGDLVGTFEVVRTKGAPAALLAPVGAATKEIDRNVAPRIHLLKDYFVDQVEDVERAALGMGMLGVIALIVASLGILGLVSYAAAQRTKEIGIRLAIGAEPRHVVRSLLAQFQGTVAYGLLAGVLLAAGLAQLLRRELYGLSTFDPVSYAGAVALFVCVSGLAALIPARRALKVDPVVALRCD